jgi:hypothetical protein
VSAEQPQDQVGLDEQIKQLANQTPNRTLSLIGQLIEDASRDLGSYKDHDNPNYRIAGMAVLRSLNGIIRCANSARDVLMREMFTTEGRERHRDDDRPRENAGSHFSAF